LQEALISLLDDFGVTLHLLIEMVDTLGSQNKENSNKNLKSIDRTPIRCITLLEHNLRKISTQLWNIFSQISMKIKLDVSR
jgi:hypothetical protein